MSRDALTFLIICLLAPPVVAVVAIAWQTLARAVRRARHVLDTPPHECDYPACEHDGWVRTR